MVRILLFVSTLFCAALQAADIPRANDLHADGTHAVDHGTPVVVLFSASYCTWCKAVKSEFFQHLESDPRYASKVVLREVEIDSAEPLTDFAGEAMSHRHFAGANKTFLVPTVRFFDGRGNELVEPIVGVPTLDYYGWYLDQRIRESLNTIGAESG